MSKRDYYEVLGINKNATQDEIKKAYRKLAITNHPDKNPGDKAAEDRFKEATESYEVLSDESKRRNYDQFGFAGVDSSQGFGGAAYRDFSDIFGGFGDIFGSMFGSNPFSRSQRTTTPTKGQSIRITTNIDLKDLYNDTEKEITYKHLVKCEHCNGTGSKDKTETTCPTCHGSGMFTQRQGFMSFSTTCSRCGGTGKVIEHPCNDCNGEGVIKKEDTVKVKIPKDFSIGSDLLINNKGNYVKGCYESGDLYIKIDLNEDELFIKENHDLITPLEITYDEAICGTTKHITLPDGEDLEVVVPEGTQPFNYIKVKNKGINGKGNLYIKVIILIPTGLSKEQLDKIKNLVKELGV